ncbi:hypothetical protein BC829DRAFT_462786 [Chytridium lagenaria]|nr:hypothetical protein BC829DRAFT_462786 [Chytridium lagenaria]
MSGGPASPGISRPIASMGRRQRGIVRRNSAPVAPTTPTAGTSAQNLVVTASTTTQTNVPEAAIAPAAEATDADDEDSDTPATGSDDVMRSRLNRLQMMLHNNLLGHLLLGPCLDGIQEEARYHQLPRDRLRGSFGDIILVEHDSCWWGVVLGHGHQGNRELPGFA